MIKLPSNYDNWKTSGPNEEEYVIDQDWRGQDIWNYESDRYYNTDDGWVHEDEVDEYMKYIWGDKIVPGDF